MTVTVVTAHNAKEFASDFMDKVRTLRCVENEDIRFRSARVEIGKYQVAGYDIKATGEDGAFVLSRGESIFAFPMEGVWEIDNHSVKVSNEYGTYHWVANPLW